MAFTNHEDATRYALAGKAILTMESERTGAHYTYQIEAHKKPKANGPSHFVSLLMGPNNEADYAYIGIIGGNVFRTTERSKLPYDSLPIVAFKWIWRHLTERHQLPPDCVIRHNGHCGKCGRRLTTPASIDLGIGPECAKKFSIEKPAKAKASNVTPIRNRPMLASGAGPVWFQ